MNEWLSKPWVIRIISLLLAIFAFIVISIDNQDRRTADIGGFDSIFNNTRETQVLEGVPVSIQIDDERYVVSGVPQTVSVTLQGTVSVVQSTATQRNFDVYVDLEDLEPGTQTVPIEYEGISSRLSVEINPAYVDVLIEERATAEYSVNVDFTNQDGLQPGYELVSATVIPQTIQITSAQSIVERISMVTAYVDVEGLGSNMTFVDIPVRVYDNEGNQLNARIEPEVVSIEVEVANPNKTVPVVIETTGTLPEDLRIISMESDMTEVQLFAAQEDLDNINTVNTEPINLSNITEPTMIEVSLEIPDGTRLISHEAVVVTIEVEELVEETFEDIAIDIENLNNEFTSSFIDPVSGTLDIIITGFLSDLANVSTSDFQLMIDLEGLEDGEHILPVNVQGPDEFEVLLTMNEVIVEVQ